MSAEDRELLELAAKAAGLPYIKPLPEYDGSLGLEVGSDNPMRCWSWNPLTDDGDALRLAVDLGLCFGPNFDGDHAVCFGGDGRNITEPLNPSRHAATRRAITRAAAEIGRAMP